MKKRGISPLIAFVLLFALVSSIGAFVTIWYKSASEKQFTTTMDEFVNAEECKEVEYEVVFEYDACKIALYNLGKFKIDKVQADYYMLDASHETSVQDLEIMPKYGNYIINPPDFEKAKFTPILIRDDKRIICPDELEYTKEQEFGGCNCTIDNDCPDGYICDEEVCELGAECAVDADCVGDLNLCIDDSCVLVDCVSEGDCNEGEECIDNSCVFTGECLKDSDCTNPSFPECVGTECKVCDTADDSPCVFPESYCHDYSQCVNCRGNKDCTDPLLPTCSNYNCVECTGLVPGECNGTKPYCSFEDNICVECTKDSDCSTGYVCDSNSCKTPCSVALTLDGLDEDITRTAIAKTHPVDIYAAQTNPSTGVGTLYIDGIGHSKTSDITPIKLDDYGFEIGKHNISFYCDSLTTKYAKGYKTHFATIEASKPKGTVNLLINNIDKDLTLLAPANLDIVATVNPPIGGHLELWVVNPWNTTKLWDEGDGTINSKVEGATILGLWNFTVIFVGDGGYAWNYETHFLDLRSIIK